MRRRIRDRRLIAAVNKRIKAAVAQSKTTLAGLVGVGHPTAGQAYYRRKRAEGKSPEEALRCLKRRLSDAVYRCLLADQHLPPSLVGLRPT